MADTTKSIIAELDRFVPQKDKHMIIESRAQHSINSIINLMVLIEESFTEEEADELNKRIINSVRARDPAKFSRKIREMRKNTNGRI